MKISNGVKKYSIVLSLCLLVSSLATAGKAQAYYPVLNVSSSGSSTTISISGGQPNTSVVINYTPSGSNLATNINGMTDYNGSFTTMVNSVGGSQVSATVGGQTVYGNNNGYTGGCTYNCGNPYGLSLSQNNLSLNVGQSGTVTANNYSGYGSVYISSNSNLSTASASVSGNQITIYGIASGNTNISVCSNNGGCANLYVTVSGSGNCGYYGCNVGGFTLSQTSLSLNVGQSGTVTANYPYPVYGNTNNVYIAGNSNPGAASATVSGNQIIVYGASNGSTNISICATSSGGACATLYVTVSGTTSGTITFSPISANLGVGQNSTVYISASYYGTALYISNNSNPGAISASLSGSTLYLKGLSLGSGTITVCQSNSTCGSLYVDITGSVLGATTAALNIGDNFFGSGTVTIPVGGTVAWTNNGNMTHTVTADDGSFNSGNMVRNAVFSKVFNTPGTYRYHCIFHGGSGGAGMSGIVVVTGTGISTFSLSQTNLNLNLGQSGTITAYGGGSSIYVTSNSSPNVASYTLSGNSINVYGNSPGIATLNVCSNSGYGCANLFVTVGGGYPYGGGGLLYPGGGSVLGATTFQSGQLISEGPAVYMVYKNTKAVFANASAFLGLGYKFSNVLAVGNSGLLDSGYKITSSQVQHPWGAWVKSGQTVYFVHDSGLIPVPDWATFVNNGGQASFIVPANIYDFRLPILSVMQINDSRPR